MNVCRFPGVYKTKELTKTFKILLEKQNLQNFSEFLHLTPSGYDPDVVRGF